MKIRILLKPVFVVLNLEIFQKTFKSFFKVMKQQEIFNHFMKLFKLCSEIEFKA